ncbi:flagellar hook protein FlgE [Aliidiomarina minuta]|uniref:Flagellar hook protein FlgE n=1 Tax=Aliidiomarina minuta TaxID=880057 RepID=A0A432W8E4_9GAMM|nr:flagellar hook protein FlgE [Aliidiomarina minuta]RUO26397.1 flagellar hook protein FlgE [Aliidiomarina minuta]
MSYFIALSGLSASQRDLDTSSNNIANVNTSGFKGSRAEFADVYATSVFTNSRTKVGDGVQTQRVAQQFSQGTLEFTENSLDMAIKGNGFFVTAPEPGSQDFSFTRAGAFKMDRNNFIVDNSGSNLLAYPVNEETGQNSSTALSTTGPVEIPSTAGAPTPTGNIYQSVNLDSRSPEIVTGAGLDFNPDDPATYTDSTSATVYDSLGESHTVTTYYARRGDGEWDVYKTVDGQTVNFDTTGGVVGEPAADGSTGVRIEFDASGNPTGPLTADGTFPAGQFVFTPPNGAEDLDLTFNFRSLGGSDRPTQFASAFELTALEQDGTTVGRLTGVDVDESGLIAASYSNGDTKFLGRVAIVSFNNEQGLSQAGGTKWKQSIDSGEPITGVAGSGTFGGIESSALENSNVNLTEELVDIIVAQRNYQANSRSLEVNSTLQQTILQIR